MKTDDETRFRWLDDDLSAGEEKDYEKMRSELASELQERDKVREMKRMLRENVARHVEPPYGEFFNARIRSQIHQQEHAGSGRGSHWADWRKQAWMAAAACFAMVISFWTGTRMRDPSPAITEVSVEGAPKAIPVDLLVYSPVIGVEAEHFSSANGTVIVLNGVPAIPDSVDFHSTAMMVPNTPDQSMVRAASDDPDFMKP
jgi:hypothetical protein